jgi:hypothetical protein
MYRSETLTDRRSTRVHAAPGGNQQFSIFGGQEDSQPAPAARQPTSIPVMGDAPVAGQRVAVRTEHTGISAHPSTRVHAAPGGRQQFNIFSGAAEDPAPAAQSTKASSAPVANGGPVAGLRVPVRTEHTGISEHPSTRVHAAPGGNQQFNIFSSSVDNPLSRSATAAAPVAQAAAPPATVAPVSAPVAPSQLAAGQRVAVRTQHSGICDVPSTFVHAAPGGNSDMSSIIGGSTANDRIAAMKARREASAAPLANATNIVG